MQTGPITQQQLKSLTMLQLVNWLGVLGLVLYFIFVANDPSWQYVLPIGIGIQLMALVPTLPNKRGIRSTWLSYSVGMALVIGIGFLIMETATLGIQFVYLFILLAACLFIGSGVFVLGEVRKTFGRKNA